MAMQVDSQAKGCRIVVLHGDQLVRESIGLTLQQAGFNVVGQSSTIRDLLEMVERLVPNVVLLEWEAAYGDLDAVKGVSLGGKCCVVLLARPSGRNGLLPAIRAGVSGCLSANMSAEEFVQSLNVVRSSRVLVLSQDLAYNALAEEGVAEEDPSMSDREREVVGLIAQGASNREIAEALIVSEHTVKVHLRNILSKLDLRNRQQVAAYAVREGLLPKAASEDVTTAAV
jgi:DNA-binding NarL/FixJ family response regulator